MLNSHEIYKEDAAIRTHAASMARDFSQNEMEYQMGYLEAEQPHPATRGMGEAFQRDTAEGVRMLLHADDMMADAAAGLLLSDAYAAFERKVFDTLCSGKHITLSGCGSSGRLCMQLERSWRVAMDAVAERFPAKREALKRFADQVDTIMTGGDYAVIRSVEMFEDYFVLGRLQTRKRALSGGDLLIGVTATGETTSILGTAEQALADGADVYMLVCSDPEVVSSRLKRTQAVYLHPNARALYLPCGPMALTGSTRMQSSSFEQFVGAVAFERALCRILCEMGIDMQVHELPWYAENFTVMADSLAAPESACVIAAQIEKERAVYENGGLVTYFATDYLMDILTDTTERMPTFMTPPFRPRNATVGLPSWAFVKNPTCDTPEAWRRCFARQPRCIDWSRETYLSQGIDAREVEQIPEIDTNALFQFMIGAEPDPAREGVGNLAVWVGAGEPDAAFARHAERYGAWSSLTLAAGKINAPDTPMMIFAHLALKMMLNAMSTGTMACMGRVTGNWMTYVAMANKKLVDRSARIVADQCGMEYARALEEVFCAKLWVQAQTDGIYRSPAQLVIQKYKKD